MRGIIDFTKQKIASGFMVASILCLFVSCSKSDTEVVPLSSGQLISATRWQTTEVFENGGSVNKIEDYPGVVSVSTWTLGTQNTNSGTFAFRNVSAPEGTPRAQGNFEFNENIRILTFPNGGSSLVTMTRLDKDINEYTQSVAQQIGGVAVVPQRMVIIRVVHRPYPLK